METEALAPTRTASLVQLAEWISELFDVAESAESEEDRAVAIAEIDRVISTELRSKADAIGYFDKHADSQVDLLKDMQHDIQKRIVAWQTRQDRIRSMIRYAMERLGTAKIEGSVYTLSLRKPSTSVLITDALRIPAQYIRVVPAQHVPDKAAIAKALKAGHQVSGAELQAGESSVIIR